MVPLQHLLKLYKLHNLNITSMPIKMKCKSIWIEPWTHNSFEKMTQIPTSFKTSTLLASNNSSWVETPDNKCLLINKTCKIEMNLMERRTINFSLIKCLTIIMVCKMMVSKYPGWCPTCLLISRYLTQTVLDQLMVEACNQFRPSKVFSSQINLQQICWAQRSRKSGWGSQTIIEVQLLNQFCWRCGSLW